MIKFDSIQVRTRDTLPGSFIAYILAFLPKSLTQLPHLEITFSFGSAFAATNYTASDYATALQAEMNNQLTYLANAETKYLNDLTYNNLGYEGAAEDFIAGYTKEAIKAGLDAAIASLTTAMSNEISKAANAVGSAGTTTPPDLDVVKNAAVADATDAINGKTVAQAIADMSAIRTLEVAAIEKAQAPITKAAIENKLAAVDLSKYNSTDKTQVVDGVDVTPADKMQSLIDTATTAINTAAADTTKTDAQKRTAYEAAYSTFKTGAASVPTLEDEEEANSEGNKTVAGATNAYLQYGIQTVYDAIKLSVTSDSSIYAFADDGTKTAILGNDAFYEAKTTTSKAKLFGVEIANIDRITRAEALAVNNAIFAAINASTDVVKKYAGTDATKVAPLWQVADAGNQAKFLTTLGNAMKVADVYAEVVELGASMKAETSYGVKVYDDEKVDAAVAKAESLVYADLNSTLKTATQYIDAAATALGYGTLANGALKAENYEYDKFMNAVSEAQKKFYKTFNLDGTGNDAQVKVSYGDDKTAEEDLVYLKSTYAASEASDWEDIAADAVYALANAESYADIDAALAAAKEDLSGLMLASEATAVANAQGKYIGALEKYAEEVKALKGTTDYAPATYTAALNDGKDLINDAKSVAAVESAYAEAKAILDGIKKNDELTAAKNAVISTIAALPLNANLTVADKAAVIAAYEAYKEYVQTPGATATLVTNEAVLESDLNKVLQAEKDALVERYNAEKKAIDKLYVTSDTDAAAIAEMREDLEKLISDISDFNAQIKAIKKVAQLDDLAVTVIDASDVETLLDSEKKVWNAELKVARALAVAANKPGATADQIKKALDAYAGLTDRQQYSMDASYIELINMLQEKNVESVKALKITASSSAKKGSIIVKWTVKGDTSAVEGYEIWKSTKRSSGFSKSFTTTKQSYKNTKGLKKGTRYYYKVRAIAHDAAGKKVTSDWSNKAYRIAK